MKCRMRRPFQSRRRALKKHFEIAFQVVEVQLARLHSPLLLLRWAESRCGNMHGLTYAGDIKRPFRCAGCAQEYPADLEHTNARCTTVEVVADIGDQACDQPGAHYRALARDRIQQADRIRGAAEVELPLWLDEAEVEDFLVIQARELRPQVVQRTRRLRVAAHGGTRQRRQRRDMLEAVNPCHL